MGKSEAQNGKWHELLLNNQYQKIADLIHRAQTNAGAVGDRQQEALLVAAAHLNASCVQV